MEQTKIKKRIPIRRRFLRTVLLTTIVSILAVSFTGVLCIRWIRMASEETLMEQLETNLKNVIQEQSRAVDAKLEHYDKYVEFITDTLDGMYAQKEKMISRGRMFYAPVDTREYTLTRGFASPALTEDDLREELLFFSNLEDKLAPIARENESLISTIYLGTKSGLLVSYDRYSYLSVPPEGQEVVYNYHYTEWYQRGMKEEGPFYSGVYMDSQGRGLTLTIGAGFKDENGETVGVVCMDFDLTALCEALLSTGLKDSTFTFALDHLGTLISPDSDTVDLQEYTGLTLDELDALKANPRGILEKDNKIYVCIPMEHVGWTLCARVPREAVQKSIHDTDRSIWNAFMVFILVVLLILLIAVLAINRSVNDITYPLSLLGKDIRIISNGDLSYRATVYRNDEIGDITSGMNEMVDRLNFTLNELMSSQQQVDAMAQLANQDALTGVRNKTAFMSQMKLLSEDLARGEKEFGFVMLDLNNLKLINDNYGHDKGDAAIKNLSRIIADVFAHSPVFRVDGDEFAVMLKGEDYRNVDARIHQFKTQIQKAAANKNAMPWDRVTSAIGYALYDARLDTGAESVLSRADREMYKCKRDMKS